MVDAMLQDIRYALRALRASPGFACVAILSLALGIGANTAIFSLINAVMLRSLPVSHPEELVQITIGTQAYLSNPVWEQLRDRQDLFSGIFAYGRWPLNLAKGGEARKVRGQYVSGQYFDTLGVRAALGRTLTPADDRRGCAGVAVLSYGFWEREYGARSDVLGPAISIENHPFEIVGVAQWGFTGVEVGSAADVTIPLCAEQIVNRSDSLLDKNYSQDWGWLQVMGRPEPGVSPSQVTARLKALSPGVFRTTVQPDWRTEDRQAYLRHAFSTAPAATGLSYVRRQYRQALMILLGIVGVVLLIACANVANLLLARGAAREREIAIRIALGSGRGRLIRQLLTESLLLAGAGAVLGVLLAQWTTRLLVGFLNIYLDLTLDFRVLAFAAGVAVVTGVLFGIAPAWRSAHVQPQAAMKANSRGMFQGSRFSPGKALVVLQVALSVLLVVGAGLMLSTFWTLASLDAGFERDRVLLVTVDLGQRNDAPEHRRALFREILERLRALPGVQAAGASNIVPLCGCRGTVDVVIEGYATGSRDDTAVLFNKVTDGYFKALGTAVVAGRDFNSRDTPSSPRVAIVNQSMARKYFGALNPIGRFLRIQEGKVIGEPYQIVGVVEDAKYGTLRDQMAPTLYLTRNRDSASGTVAYFELRAAGGEPGALIRSVKSAIGDIDRSASLEFNTLAARIDASLSRERLLAALSALFGTLAVLLAMIGLYGVITYNVARRRNEIGIRLALGADQGRVVGMVMREVVVLVTAGLALGLSVAALTTRFVASLLYGLKPNDPLTFTLAAAVLAGMGSIAGYLPARRASRLDPMSALREE